MGIVGSIGEGFYAEAACYKLVVVAKELKATYEIVRGAQILLRLGTRRIVVVQSVG